MIVSSPAGSSSPRSFSRSLPLARLTQALLLPLLLAAALAMTAGAAHAQTGPQAGTDTMDPRLTDPAAVERYRHLAGELRCLVCQNQTLADSDASLAVDLRHQVEAMIVEGQSDDQIKEYLVDRYGEFVLFRPPVQRSTWLLWFGPFGLLAIGAGVWFAMQRQRKPAPGGKDAQGRPSGTPTVANDASNASAAAELDRARRMLDGS